MTSRLKSLMSDYFDSSNHDTFMSSPVEAIGLITEYSVPVIPCVSTWEIVTDPNRLMRSFEFNDELSLKYFVCELLDYQDDVGHHAKMIIQAGKVIIEVYTHDVDDVTELDKEYASMADSIFEDISHMVEFNYPSLTGD